MRKDANQLKHAFNKLVHIHMRWFFPSFFFVVPYNVNSFCVVVVKARNSTPSAGLQKNKSKSRKIKWTMTLFRRFSIYTYLQHVIYFCGPHIAYHLMPCCPHCKLASMLLVVHTRLRFTLYSNVGIYIRLHLFRNNIHLYTAKIFIVFYFI